METKLKQSQYDCKNKKSSRESDKNFPGLIVGYGGKIICNNSSFNSCNFEL